MRVCAYPFKRMKKRSFAEHDLRMGWRGFPSLRDATRTPYPIDQEKYLTQYFKPPSLVGGSLITDN